MSSSDQTAPHPRHAQLAQRMVDAAIANAWPAGMRMREEELACQFGVSRTPVRAALQFLAQLGMMEASPSRGFVLAQSGNALIGTIVSVPQLPEERLRDAMIRDRLAGKITAEQSQVSLARHYDVSLPMLQRVLHRMEQEGLVARNGWRWAFVPTLESGRSQTASYELRLMIEPAAILLSGFQPDPAILRQLIDEHQTLIRTLDEALHTPPAVFEVDAKFHETLAGFSRNPFVENIVRQQNALRRLLELKSYGNRARVAAWSEEHLNILRALAAGKRTEASSMLRQHLTQAQAAAEKAHRDVARTRRSKARSPARPMSSPFSPNRAECPLAQDDALRRSSSST